ncbi:2,4'-dihydroxyacetophenone dioxygenase family protein [Paraburkholderia dilworthii]|uniref:2,4'-dihydroxyacetophenone dioxygenase family protein n=1 Tax=Paraburkholderia dilworthii TaxID=948106 RepID=A0ABW9D3B2_9BURK
MSFSKDDGSLMTNSPFDAVPVHVDPADVPWLLLHPSLPGIRVKYLRLDPAGGEMVSLLSMPVGASVPRHHHTGSVTVYTLQGKWRYLEHDWIATPGSVVWEPAGSTHRPEMLESATGVVITLNIMRGSLEVLNRHGDVVAVENCETALVRQRTVANDISR